MIKLKEILFRGKIKDTNKWAIGYYTTNSCTTGIGVPTIETEYNDYEIEPNSLSQFTGLYDKNGFRIFENDVIEIEGGRIERIVWISGVYTIGYDLIPIDKINNPLPRWTQLFNKDHITLKSIMILTDIDKFTLMEYSK